MTSDQRAAAEACGCAIVPATEDQVRRLTVQRRVFRIGGEPHLVVRDGFNETHATVASLIAGRMRTAPVPVAEAVAPPGPVPATPPPDAAVPQETVGEPRQPE